MLNANLAKLKKACFFLLQTLCRSSPFMQVSSDIPMAAEAEDQQQQQKWEGKATAKLKRVRAEQVWPLLEDFCNLHKWIPTIDTCYQVEGLNGQPGLVRYCSSSSTIEGNKEIIKWCHEKLLAIDPVVRCLSYEILDNNFGFQSYSATIKVLPLPNSSGDDEDQKLGCEIEWSFLADPADGLTYEAFSSYINFSLQGMAENMEKALQSS